MLVLGYKIHQNEPALTNAPLCMDCGVDRTLCFSLGSCPPTNTLIAKCSKSVIEVLKLGFIQLDGLKMGK
jgi:hypothetical protein